MRVAIYTRVSTMMQVDGGYSLDGQRQLLQDYAVSRGMKIVGIFEDAGISGKTTARPAYQEILSLVNSKQIDAVIVWKISRFSRSFTDLLATVEMMLKKEVALISFSEQIDLSSASGKLLFNLLGSVAEFEREQLAENVKMAMVQAVTAGRRTASFVTGYYIDQDTKKFLIDEKEAKVIRFIYSNYIRLVSMNEVKALLDSKGLTGKRGRPYNANTISHILKNPIYCGYSRFEGQILFKGTTVPPILAEKTFDEVQYILKSKESYNCKSKAKTIEEWLDL